MELLIGRQSVRLIASGLRLDSWAAMNAHTSRKWARTDGSLDIPLASMALSRTADIWLLVNGPIPVLVMSTSLGSSLLRGSPPFEPSLPPGTSLESPDLCASKFFIKFWSCDVGIFRPPCDPIGALACGICGICGMGGVDGIDICGALLGAIALGLP